MSVVSDPRAPRWGLIAFFAGLASLAFYVLIQRGVIVSYDGRIMVDVGRNLALHGSLRTSPGVDYLKLNTPFSSYGIGNSLVAAAIIAVRRVESVQNAPVMTLVNPLLLACSAGLIVMIGRRLGWRPLVAVVAALCFSTLTMAAAFSTEFLSEPGVTLAVLLILYAITVSWRHEVAAMLVGALALAYGILQRSDSLLLLLPLGALVLSPGQWRAALRQPRRLLALTPVLAAMGWVAWYDEYRFGSVFEFGYRGESFTTPLGHGLNLLVLSPGRGFFWFNLILIPGLVGAVLIWKTSWRIALAIAFGCLARVVFYAKWVAAAGGVTWGPRFLLPCCGLLAIGLGEALERVARRPRSTRIAVWTGVIALGACSAVVSVASWWVPYEQYWNKVTMRQPGETAAQVAQRAHDYFYSLRDSEIPGTIRLLVSARPFAPEHLRNGLSAAGAVALVMAVLSVVLAALLSWGRPGDRGPPSSERLANIVQRLRAYVSRRRQSPSTAEMAQ